MRNEQGEGRIMKMEEVVSTYEWCESGLRWSAYQNLGGTMDWYYFCEPLAHIYQCRLHGFFLSYCRFNSWKWLKVLQSVFILKMVGIYLTGNPNDDWWVWASTPNRFVITHSAYHMLRRSSQPSQDSGPGRNVIWKINVYPEVEIFLWKICQNRLPTLDCIVGIIHS